MGFRSTSTRRTTAASAVSSQAVMVNTGNSVGGVGAFSAVGSTIAGNTSISLGVTTVGQSSSQSTTTVSAGPTIANVQYLDANNAVISGDIAVSTLGGNILITGTGFVANSSVYINNTLASNTYISGTQIRAVCPPSSAGNVALMIFTPTLVGTISTNGVRYSGVPTWTTAAVSFQNNTAGNVALVATSDSTLTYTLQSGSTLPTGISLNSAGYLAGTATGYSTNTSSTVVVVATDLEGQATQQTLNITITVSDPQFPYTTLLLNGETAVTPFIKDSSTNSFPLTIAGDTRADKFSPYRGDGYYSNYFNGTSAYLSAPTNVAYQFGSGDFTIEFWAYPISMAGYAVFGGVWTGTNSTSSWLVTVGATDTTALRFGYSDGTTATFVESTTGAVKLNTWTHLVVVRASGVLKMFSNGIQVYSSAVATTFASPASALVLGAAGAANYGQFYASNFRVVKGTAVYTSAFTPSTTPLTAISGTSALFCQSNRFIDTSSINATLTLTGGPTISPNIPFAASSSYATYGSAYFDGTGDYLGLTGATALNLGSSTCCLELWVNPSTVTNASAQQLFQAGTGNLALLILNGGAVQPGQYGTSGFAQTTATITPGTWSHIAVTRDASNNWRVFINGVLQGYQNYSFTPNNNGLQIGGGSGSNGYLIGYIADFRVTVGSIPTAYTTASTTVGTSVFTPPTAPLTTVTNTQLLALQYNGGANNYGIIDNGPFNNVITRAGNATQGTFSPYSPTGWSISYPALAYMTYAANPIGTFGAGATFTVEAWVNMSTYSATNYFFTLLSSCDQGTALYWAIGIGSTGLATVYWYDGATKSCAGSTALAKGTWYHVAVNVTAGVVKIYINGAAETLTGTTTLTNPTGNSAYTTGCERGSSNGGSSGYISNLRTNTGALYPSAFTPSTTPLTNVANSTLLTAQSNRFVDNSSSARAITPFATTPPSVQAFSPFSPGAAYTPSLHGGSAYFDGSGDYLTLLGSAATNLGASTSTPFTVEAWVYPTVSKDTTVIGCVGSVWRLALTSANLVSWVFNTSSVQTSTDTIKLNQWNHIAFTYDGLNTGTSNKMFVNGIMQSSQGQLIPPSNTAGIIYVGRNPDSTAWDFQGYIADGRIIRGLAAYTANFSLTTQPLTSPTSTPAGLLLNMTNGGIVDAHSTNNFETVGSVQLSTQVTKYGSGAIGPLSNASGASNYLTAPHSPIHNMITGDFTIEFWFYPINWTVTNGFILCKDGVSGTNYPQWAIKLNGTGNILFQIGASGGAVTNQVLTSTSTVALATWSHVAAVRSGTTLTIYINGVARGTATQTITMVASSRPLFINWQGSGATNDGVNAYLDDLRITNGFARYTANFTPPTSGMLGQ